MTEGLLPGARQRDEESKAFVLALATTDSDEFLAQRALRRAETAVRIRDALKSHGYPSYGYSLSAISQLNPAAFAAAYEAAHTGEDIEQSVSSDAGATPDAMSFIPLQETSDKSAGGLPLQSS